MKTSGTDGDAMDTRSSQASASFQSGDLVQVELLTESTFADEQGEQDEVIPQGTQLVGVWEQAVSRRRHLCSQHQWNNLDIRPRGRGALPAGPGVCSLEGTATNLLHDPLIQAIVVNFRDTTERKQAEEERHQLLVREQAARAEVEARAAELTATFEAITDGVAIYDAKGVICYTNPPTAGFSRVKKRLIPHGSISTTTSSGWVCAIWREGPYQENSSQRCGAHAPGISCAALARAENIILNISGAPTRDATGQMMGGVMVFRDVTEQRRLEQQLRYSERKLRSLVESNILGVAVSDSAGRIHEVNDQFAQLVGYSKEELLSGAVIKDQLIPVDYREALAQHEEILLATGAMPPWEKECLRKDGSRVPTLMAGALLDQERGLALVLFHDISERKEVERRKQEFLSMVHHNYVWFRIASVFFVRGIAGVFFALLTC